MKLNEIKLNPKPHKHKQQVGMPEDMPVIAWLTPAKGPNDIKGVRLAYIQPVIPHFDYLIAAANEEAERGNDLEAERAENLRKMKKDTVNSGQRFFTPDLGWWPNTETFQRGDAGFDGITKGFLQSKYPNLRIVKSSDEAIRLAKEAGII